MPTMASSLDRPRRIAVLLAGGVGVRIGLVIPKQLLKVAGKTLLEHTIAVLDAHPMVDEIIVMMAPGHLDAVRAIVRTGGYDKVSAIEEGGLTRNQTTQRALAAMSPDESHVLFHDAVRPLLSARIITECFEALEEHPAVDVAIPSADTIIEVGPHNTIRNIPPRASLRRGQTPQAFRSSVIRRAYALADQDPGFQATDDCTVVLRYLPDEPIWVVRGDEWNMKVTDPIDVYLADRLFQLAHAEGPERVSEDDYRSALSGRSVVVFGGSSGIGSDICRLAEQYGATVFSFSRSSTGTHVERKADLVAAADLVLAETGRIDHVVNSAGILPRGTLAETSEETVYAATDINYLAPVFMAQVFHPHLAATKGSLLLFTSSSYTRGRSGYSLYSSAKAATVNLTQALADEWAAEGARVNCINPERTATPMRTKAFGQEPAHSLLESEVVARTSLDVLVSDFTGHVIDVRREVPAG
jgi:ribitol-5-phosphate 2-dehydrogenase (NADP+) / D-ribitol-5-phosphate cytidylyltransferase